MSEKKEDELLIDHNHNGLERRGFAGPDEGAGGTTESALGITDVNYVQGNHALAVVSARVSTI